LPDWPAVIKAGEVLMLGGAFADGDRGLARIFHSWIEERSGSGVTRLVNIEPNETTHHRFFFDRL
jgi:hypothetical protein